MQYQRFECSSVLAPELGTSWVHELMLTLLITSSEIYITLSDESRQCEISCCSLWVLNRNELLSFSSFLAVLQYRHYRIHSKVF